MALFTKTPILTGKFKLVINFKTGTSYKSPTLDLPIIFDDRKKAMFAARELVVNPHVPLEDLGLAFPGHSISHVEVVAI